MVWKFCAVQIMRKYYCVLEAWYTQINGNQGGYTYKVLLLKYLATVCTNVVEKKLTLKNFNSKNHLAHFTNLVMKIMALYIIGKYDRNFNNNFFKLLIFFKCQTISLNL